MPVSAKHSSATSEWHTPVEIIERARRVLGVIDLDPASCAAANERVGALEYLDESQDGLTEPWGLHTRTPGFSVWLNPPGGTRDRQSLALLFWARLMEHVRIGVISHALFLAFNHELLQVSQRRAYPALAAFPLCAPAKRIRYLRPDGTPGPSPTHSSLIAYVPGTVDNTGGFVEAFSDLGAILLPGGVK